MANDDFQRNFLYINNGPSGGYGFTRYEEETDILVTESLQSFGGYWGDYDLDGDLDLFVANNVAENSLFQNTASQNGNHWINLNLVGTISNYSAIGASVTASAMVHGESITQYREVSAQTGFGGQNSLNVEFGLGDANKIDEIHILWPPNINNENVGIMRTLCDVPANNFLKVIEAENTSPALGPIIAPTDPLPIGAQFNASASFTDGDFYEIVEDGLLWEKYWETHTALWDWGDGSQSPGIIDKSEGIGSVSGSHTYEAAGVYPVSLTVTDKCNLSGINIFEYAVVYDPNSGFVTGGGWVDSPSGAYTPDDDADPDLTGKAYFGFVSKYKKGQAHPRVKLSFSLKSPI